MALPVDPKFWDFLLSNAQKDWGLFVYEQDALSAQFGGTKALQVKHAIRNHQLFYRSKCAHLQTQLDLGEVWLKQMGEAAQRYGITIQ